MHGDIICCVLFYAVHLAAVEGHLPCVKFLICSAPSIDHALNARNDQVCCTSFTYTLIA